MAENLKLSSPWQIYYNQLEAMFKSDPEIKLVFSEATTELKIYVDNHEKAYALSQLLPAEKIFGNITMKISIIPSNTNTNIAAKLNLLQKALQNNPAFSYIYTSEDTLAFPANYVVFKKEVVQYRNDSLADLNGIHSDLYQNIAKDIFGEFNGIHYCTEV